MIRCNANHFARSFRRSTSRTSNLFMRQRCMSSFALSQNYIKTISYRSIEVPQSPVVGIDSACLMLEEALDPAVYSLTSSTSLSLLAEDDEEEDGCSLLQSFKARA